MKKIKLDIIGLSYSQTQSGAYVLVLEEESGKRRLAIIIGGNEAQAIALELEKMTPTRPLTHDLFKNFAVSFGIEITEVLIYNFADGIFYAKLICNDGSRTLEIDARTSDAIAMAVRFASPIYTTEEILVSAGVILDENPNQEDKDKAAGQHGATIVERTDKDLPSLSLDELNELLLKELESENYEKASTIRDELNRRKQSQ